MNTLDELISTLTSRQLEAGRWWVTVDELETAADPVTLYRAAYERKLIGQDVYSLESAGEFIGLLEAMGFRQAEDTLRLAGLFLTHDDRIDLTGRFVRHVRRAIVLHLPEPELFRGMIRQFRRFDRATQVYCETYLDLSPIAETCAAEYASDRAATTGWGPNAEVHRLTAIWYLTTLVDRRVVALGDLAPSLFELLRAVGRQEGALPPLSSRAEEQERDARRAPGAGGYDPSDLHRDGPAGQLAALRVFGMKRSEIRREYVQSRYRTLMRRYHPDVNPDGLEMAKRVNSAYGVLLTIADQT